MEDIPGLSKVDHPELFSRVPPQPKSLKPGQISEDKVKQFYEDGFLILESMYTSEELKPAECAIDDLVDELAKKLYEAGKIASLYEEYGFYDRLTMIEKEYPGANVLLYKSGKQPKAVCDLWCNERMLNLMEQLLGTADIDGLPSWNLRPKTPKSDITIVPWHQDAGYFDNTTYDGMIITAWIPFLDATEETGCLQMVRKAHKLGRVAKHVGCWKDTWYIVLEEDEMKTSLNVDMDKDVVTCPVPYGGCVIFTHFTPHRSLSNVSNKIRWSIDIRWQPAGRPSGYYGLKDSIRLRSSTDQDYQIDWAPFVAVDRRQKQYQALNSVQDDFDLSIPGPWMVKWPLVNENIHTKALATIDRSKWKNLIG